MPGAQDVRAGRAYVEVGVNDKVGAYFDKLGGAASAFGARLSGIGKDLLGVGLAAQAGLDLAVNAFANAGAELERMHLRTGVSVAGLQSLGYALQQGGIDADGMSTALAKMQRTLADAATGSDKARTALAGIGLSLADLRGLSPDQQFERIGDKINGLASAAARVSAAREIFGKAGVALLPSFAGGAAGIDNLRASFDQLGISMLSADAQGALRLTQGFSTLSTVTTGLVDKIGAALAPAVERTLPPLINAAAAAARFVDQNRGLVTAVAAGSTALIVLGGGLIATGTALRLAGPALGLVASGVRLIGGIGPAAASAVGSLTASFVGLAGSALGLATGPFRLLGTVAATLGSTFASVLGPALGIIGRLSASVSGVLVPTLTSVGSAALGVGRTLVTGIGSAAVSAVGVAGRAVLLLPGIVSTVAGLVASTVAAVPGAVSAAAGLAVGAVEAAYAVITAVGGAVIALPGTIAAAFSVVTAAIEIATSAALAVPALLSAGFAVAAAGITTATGGGSAAGAAAGAVAVAVPGAIAVAYTAAAVVVEAALAAMLAPEFLVGGAVLAIGAAAAYMGARFLLGSQTARRGLSGVATAAHAAAGSATAAFHAIGDAPGQAAASAGRGLAGTVADVSAGATAAAGQARSAAVSVGSSAIGSLAAIRAGAGSVWTSLSTGAAAAVGRIGSTLSGLTAQVAAGLGRLRSSLATVWVGLRSDALTAFAGVRDAVSTGDYGTAAAIVGTTFKLELARVIRDVWDPLLPSFYRVRGELLNGWSYLVQGVETAWSYAREYLSDWSGVTAAASKVWTYLKDGFRSLTDYIGNILGGVLIQHQARVDVETRFTGKTIDQGLADQLAAPEIQQAHNRAEGRTDLSQSDRDQLATKDEAAVRDRYRKQYVGRQLTDDELEQQVQREQQFRVGQRDSAYRKQQDAADASYQEQQAANDARFAGQHLDAATDRQRIADQQADQRKLNDAQAEKAAAGATGPTPELDKRITELTAQLKQLTDKAAAGAQVQADKQAALNKQIADAGKKVDDEGEKGDDLPESDSAGKKSERRGGSGSQTGTFNPLALFGLGGTGIGDRIAKSTEETARNTDPRNASRKATTGQGSAGTSGGGASGGDASDGTPLAAGLDDDGTLPDRYKTPVDPSLAIGKYAQPSTGDEAPKSPAQAIPDRDGALGFSYVPAFGSSLPAVPAPPPLSSEALAALDQARAGAGYANRVGRQLDQPGRGQPNAGDAANAPGRPDASGKVGEKIDRTNTLIEKLIGRVEPPTFA